MTPSLTLRLADRWVRTVVKRESWGDADKLSRRARRLFGSPRFWSAGRSLGLRVSRVQLPGITGEWIDPPAPLPGVLFYIHGGGYVACSARTHRPLTAALARLTRRRVFSLDYRLAPEHRFPAAFEDSLAGYRWLAAQMGGEASQIAVAGDSAGGGLSLALAVAVRDEGLPLPSCLVLFSPWTDMEGLIDAPHPNVERCAMFAPSNIDEFANAYLGDASRADPRASPIRSDLRGLPPVLIQVGERELLLEDSTRVHEKILDAGGTSELEVWPHVFHGWQMLDGLVPEARRAIDRAVSFIVRRLNDSAGSASAGEQQRAAANIPAFQDQTTV
jgi:epsilon-lactone hydrolase